MQAPVENIFTLLGIFDLIVKWLERFTKMHMSDSFSPNFYLITFLVYVDFLQTKPTCFLLLNEFI